MFNMEKVLNLGIIKEKFVSYSNNRKKLILLVVSMIGILMVLLSNLSSGGNKKINNNSEKHFNVSLYEADLERRLLSVVEKINGVGKAEIMVTLENSVEYIYAQEKREKIDKINDYHEKTPLKTQERNDEERKLILVDGINGKRQALVKTEIQPKIKGVVVICEGGDSQIINQRVVNLLTTILNIPSTKVYVTKSVR